MVNLNGIINLDRLFYPRNVALIGVSDIIVKGATPFLYALRKVNFPNPIYCVNSTRKKVFNENTYSSILDIPAEIDYAIIGVPAKDILQVVKECSQKGVKFVTIFTSGFSELGTEEGRLLEKEILKYTRNGMRIVGPNCLGVYCQGSRVTVTEILDIPAEVGDMAFLSQSGGHTSSFFYIGTNRGIPFNKVVSIGNQCDLTLQDFIEYFGNDEQIKVISCYVERIKDIHRFLEVLRHVSQKKPVIFWKGGATSEGIIAASSHTGAISSSYEIFKAVINQHGGIIAESMEELADLTLGARILAKKPLGRKIAIVVPGGGTAVEMTDETVRNGLEVPELPAETREKIQGLVQDVNTSTRNPVDLGILGWISDVFAKTIAYLAEAPVDIVVFYLMTERVPDMAERLGDHAFNKSFLRKIKLAMRTSTKPLICVLPNFNINDPEIAIIRRNLIQGLNKMNIPYFPSMMRAANVISKLIKYQKFVNAQKI